MASEFLIIYFLGRSFHPAMLAIDEIFIKLTKEKHPADNTRYLSFLLSESNYGLGNNNRVIQKILREKVYIIFPTPNFIDSIINNHGGFIIKNRYIEALMFTLFIYFLFSDIGS